MPNFLCKSLLFRRYYDNCIRNPIAYSPSSLRWLSSVTVTPNEHSFTVSYLIDSLGFSVEVAKKLSKLVSFKTSHKPDQAIEFLRNFGFTHTQIPRLVRAFPGVLVANLENYIKPKLKFLEDKGISRPELAVSLSTYPTVLRYSLNNKIIPTFECLRSLLPSDTEIAMTVKNHPDILVKDIEKYVSPNVSALRRKGMPDSNISKFLCHLPRSLTTRSVRFQETVDEVSEMGFSPSSFNFCRAVHVKTCRARWESKVDLYQKWGWSENDISKAFLRRPWFMATSEDKITSVMDFFVEMGLETHDLVKCPVVFGFSLKKRVIPRVQVLQVLVSKCLLKKQFSISSVLCPSDKVFLRRYVTRYMNIAPELLKIYEDEKSIDN